MPIAAIGTYNAQIKPNAPQLVAEPRMGDADELITEGSEWHSPAASRLDEHLTGPRWIKRECLNYGRLRRCVGRGGAHRLENGSSGSHDG
jgi:hypothetical protein